MRYKPVYDCWNFEGSPFVKEGWRVCVDTFVTDDSGTLLVEHGKAFLSDACMKRLTSFALNTV